MGKNWVKWTFVWQVIGSDVFEQPVAGYKGDRNGCELAFQKALDAWGLEWASIELIHVEQEELDLGELGK